MAIISLLTWPIAFLASHQAFSFLPSSRQAVCVRQILCFLGPVALPLSGLLCQTIACLSVISLEQSFLDLSDHCLTSFTPSISSASSTSLWSLTLNQHCLAPIQIPLSLFAWSWHYSAMSDYLPTLFQITLTILHITHFNNPLRS
jgi:hypothetical protein